MAPLSGKVALVTGAARGQGRAHAVTLAQQGADIIAIDIAADIPSVAYPLGSAEDLAETAAEVEKLDRRVVTATADVRSQEQLDAAVAQGISELGGIDILVANAGVLGIGSFWELGEQTWTDLVDTNLNGVWRSAKAVAPHMIERGSGAIVMTASVNGLEPSAVYAHYTAAKHGVIGLMKAVALELAPHGVRCNAVCPGAIDTTMVNWPGVYDMFHGGPGGSRVDAENGGRGFHALKGTALIDPQRVSDAVAFLASDSASAITGAALPVDAGHLLLTGINMAPQA
jgi:SDR family mycofactocin-dependent oxidoreductase